MSNANDALACPCARELLSAIGDGEAVGTADLAAHLESCAACRDFELRIGALSTAFAPLREIELPEAVAARFLAAGDVPTRRVTRIRATALRIAAGLVGLLSIGAAGWGFSARAAGAAGAAPATEASWLEPLAGRALHPADAGLRSWSEAMGIVMNGDRK